MHDETPIVKLINDYRKSTIQSEAEVRSKFIVPLLRLLGYPAEYRAEEFPVYGYEGRPKLHPKCADFIQFSDPDFAVHRGSKEEDKKWVHSHSLLVVEAKKPGEMPVDDDLGQAQFYTMWTRAVAYIETDGERFIARVFNQIQKDYEVLNVKVDELANSSKLQLLRYESVKRIKEECGFSIPPDSPTRIDFSSDHFWDNSIRKLSDRLYVNWKKGCLAKDFESALAAAPAAWMTEKNAPPADGMASSIVYLSPSQLRLLSILVQGEGAVVSKKELSERIRLALDEERKNGYKAAEINVEVCVKSLCDVLRSISPNLAGIIKDSEKGFCIDIAQDDPNSDLYSEYSACRVYSACNDGYSKYSENDGYSADDDWTVLKSDWDHEEKEIKTEKYIDIDEKKVKMKAGRIKEEFRQAWLRRHYNQVCYSFQNKISNARYDSYGGEKVFGNYKMAQLYTNAYAKLQNNNGTDVMLDYVERWFEGAPGKEQFGRVLVLHGQPGDGKTTFCKKAVYAHCKEGWLRNASHVLWISLNPVDSNREIVSGDKNKLDLSRAFCLIRDLTKRDKRDKSYFIEPEDVNRSLIIFDGFDELVGDLRKDENINSFWDFCRSVMAIAKAQGYGWNAVVTSRTMCIKDDLQRRDLLPVDEKAAVSVASFAPFKEEQQDAMIDRMIQIDKEKQPIASASAYCEAIDQEDNLEHYKNDVLPGLRRLRFRKQSSQKGEEEVEEFNDLLKIPSLFRMIVRSRFRETAGINNVAELYTSLTEKLFTYKSIDEKKKQKLKKNYEDIAARIFQDNEDTCSYKEGEIPEDSELIYAFLTKSDRTKEGRLGFLHGTFRQYFLARFIISSIEGKNADSESGTTKEDILTKLFAAMRARRITEPFVWQMINEVARMEHKAGGLSQEKIKDVLRWLDDTDNFAEVLKRRELPEGSDAEKDELLAAEHAVFNLIGSLAYAEGACLGEEDGDDTAGTSEDTAAVNGTTAGKTEKIRYRIAYADYPNVCGLLRRGDYTGIYLRGMNLQDCNLQNARLEDADLKGTNLAHANISGANLAGAKLDGIHLNGAHLENAQFSNAYQNGVNIEADRSYIKAAVLQGAVLDDAHLEGANLRGVVLMDAHLNQAHLERANLSNAKLGNTYIQDAFLSQVNLKGAFMKGAHLDRTDLKWSCLEEAYLYGAQLEGAHLEHARMAGAYMDRANLKKTFLNYADLRSAWLDGAEMAEADMEGTILENAYMTEEQYNCFKAKKALGLASELPEGIVNEVNLREIEGTGKTFAFGSYPHNSEYRKETIRWRVLKCEYDRALVITEDLVDCQLYNETSRFVTWDVCSLREWMNREFINKAFDDDERLKIMEVCNQNPDNTKFGTRGGNATWDRVFALTIEEALAMFDGNADRMAGVTDYAKMQGSYVTSYHRTKDRKETGWWWLRSPGIHSNLAANVDTGGFVNGLGHSVGGSFVVSVRPALWLHL